MVENGARASGLLREAAGGLLCAAAATAAGRLAVRHERGLAEVVPRTEVAGGVDAVVPARDEASQIRACVLALLAQGEVRLTVVDDGSRDGTGERAAAAGATVLRIEGDPPPGWTGKTHACHRGARGGDGPWLAFVDADVTLAPGALAALVAHAEANGLDAVSPLLRQRCPGLVEGLLVPLAYWQYAVGLPGAGRGGVGAPGDGGRALLNGQCLVVRRDRYEACGGHAHTEVRGTQVEDAALARLLVRSGGHVGLVRGQRLGAVRMYASAAAVRRGFLKNAGELLRADPWRGMLVAGAGVTLSRVPGLMLAALRRPSPGRVGGAVVAWLAPAAILGPRYRACGRSAALALAHPLAAPALQAIAVESLLRLVLRHPPRWKGRALQRPPRTPQR